MALPRLNVEKDDANKAVTYTVPVQTGAGVTVSTVTVQKKTGRLVVTLDLDAALAGQTWAQFCVGLESGVKIV